MPKAVFRTDAGPTIGGGHLARCLTLAAALAAKGWAVALAVSRETAAHASGPLKHWPTLVLPDDGSVAESAAMAKQWPEGTDWLIVDHYGRDAVLERACRPWAQRIFVFDDLADRDHDCDLLLDPAVTRQPEHYASRVPPAARLLLGPHYALLRPHYAAARPTSLARRGAGQLSRILVSFGLGQAALPFAEMALDGIRAAGLTRLAVDVVAATRSSAVRNEPGITWHEPLPDLSGLIAAADLAIGAGGTTSWERCCLGTPSLLAIIAENQRDNVESLVAAGAAMLTEDAASIADALAFLRRNPSALAEMAQRAASLCDGGGTDRVVAALA